MKKTLLTMALALMLGLGATAQNTSNWFNWEDTEDYYDFDVSSIGMFDWGVFNDLFEWSTEVNIIDDWVANFDQLGDRTGIEISLPVLAGLGIAYAVTKRHKDE